MQICAVFRQSQSFREALGMLSKAPEMMWSVQEPPQESLCAKTGTSLQPTLCCRVFGHVCIPNELHQPALATDKSSYWQLDDLIARGFGNTLARDRNSGCSSTVIQRRQGSNNCLFCIKASFRLRLKACSQKKTTDVHNGSLCVQRSL